MSENKHRPKLSRRTAERVLYILVILGLLLYGYCGIPRSPPGLWSHHECLFHLNTKPIMTQVRNFISDNFRTIIIIVSFVVTLYVQHVSNTEHINELTRRCQTLELKVQDQYERIDAIKLDKAVFEATMTQFTSLQTDIREMREDIKELLKQKR